VIDAANASYRHAVCAGPLLLQAQIVDEVFLKQQRVRQIIGFPHHEHLGYSSGIQASNHTIRQSAAPSQDTGIRCAPFHKLSARPGGLLAAG
jgi:hypothetical protein